jgi:PHD/YefM family antitoxin component YafN of YafNO toxin-antitoxin module
MKTLEISKATKPLSDYARAIEQEAVIVVKNGKPVAVLSSAKGMDAESIALANNPKFVAIINKSRARQEAEGGISLHKMYRRLGLKRPVRAAPKKRRKTM